MDFGWGKVGVVSVARRTILSMRVFILGLICFAIGGCMETKEDRESRLTYWPNKEVAARYVGKMTDDEVAVFRTKLSQTKFPAPAFTLARMLPPTLEPHGREFVDGKDFMRGTPSIGTYDPFGGNVSDYWLNENTVLRVGTVYYYNGQDHFEREEWCELMTPKKAFQADNRGPFQRGKETQGKNR